MSEHFGEYRNTGTQTQSLSTFIWPSMRSSVLISWLLLQLISLTAYAAFITWQKDNALHSHLATSNLVISEAIDVGDWDFALNVLKASSSVGDISNLTLGSHDNKTIYSGPLGTPSFGVGYLCEENGADIKIRGCVRIFGLVEMSNFIVFFAISLIFSFFSFTQLRNRFLRTLTHVADSLAAGLEGHSSNIHEIKAVQTRVINLMLEREISTKQKALASLAAQVAHDIRSPLGALKIVAAKFPDTEATKKHMVNLVTKRIEEIANKLLNQYRAPDSVQMPSVDIIPVIKNIIAEKQLTPTSSKLDISFLEPLVKEILVALDPNELSTIISNLINNSVESISASVGSVVVSVEVNERTCLLSVADTGNGIAEAKIKSIGREGYKSDKFNGSGLGLLHARRKIDDWGGNLEIKSVIGKGTIIKIELPMRTQLEHMPTSSISNISKQASDVAMETHA